MLRRGAQRGPKMLDDLVEVLEQVGKDGLRAQRRQHGLLALEQRVHEVLVERGPRRQDEIEHLERDAQEVDVQLQRLLLLQHARARMRLSGCTRTCTCR